MKAAGDRLLKDKSTGCGRLGDRIRSLSDVSTDVIDLRTGGK